MALHEIVIGEVKADRSLKILALLAECVGEASQATHVESRRTIQAFDMAGRGLAHIGKTGNALLFGSHYLWRAEFALSNDRIIRPISLDDLSEVNVRTVDVLNRIYIGP